MGARGGTGGWLNSMAGLPAAGLLEREGLAIIIFLVAVTRN